MPHRKTAHLLCAALRVYDLELARRLGVIVGTRTHAEKKVVQCNIAYGLWFDSSGVVGSIHRLNTATEYIGYRPSDSQATALLKPFEDPEGGAQGCAPFFDAAGCRIEKSPQPHRRQICPGTKEFSLVPFLTRACGARPSGRLRRSRRKRRSAPKKGTRAKRGSSAVAFLSHARGARPRIQVWSKLFRPASQFAPARKRVQRFVR